MAADFFSRDQVEDNVYRLDRKRPKNLMPKKESRYGIREDYYKRMRMYA